MPRLGGAESPGLDYRPAPFDMASQLGLSLPSLPHRPSPKCAVVWSTIHWVL